MNQTVLVMRNPREAMISYHNLIYEIGYAKDWQTAYSFQSRVYTVRPPVYTWEAWRDRYFEKEIHWWGWFIDFWMEGGLLRDIVTHRKANITHWDECAISHEHRYPSLEGYVSPPVDEYHRRCKEENFGMSNCKPVSVVSYEKLATAEMGPEETKKLIDAIEGKEGMNVIEEIAQPCVWRELVFKKVGGRLNDNRNGKGPTRTEFVFTDVQLQTIRDVIQTYVEKYSSREWVDNAVAVDLVGYLEEFRDSVDEEINMKPKVRDQAGGGSAGGGRGTGRRTKNKNELRKKPKKLNTAANAKNDKENVN